MEYLYLQSQGFRAKTKIEFTEPILFLNSTHYLNILQLKQLSRPDLMEILSYKAVQVPFEEDGKPRAEYRIKTFKFKGTTIKLLVTGDKVLLSTELTVYKIPFGPHPYMIKLQQLSDMFRCTPYNQLVQFIKKLGIIPRNPTPLEAAIISNQNRNLISNKLNETLLIPYTNDIKTLFSMIWLGVSSKALFKYLTEIRPISQYEEEITALGIPSLTRASCKLKFASETRLKY